MHIHTPENIFFVYRVFRLSQKGDFITDVVHLKAEGKGPRKPDHEIIRHMVNTTLYHCRDPYTDPILVHCTKGIGATGTFIAFFKLRDALYK